MRPAPRSPWAAVAAVGVMVLIFATMLLSDFRFEAGAYPPGYGDPIYALEFARTPADVAAVLGQEGGPGYGAKIAKLSNATRADIWFAVAYAGFLFTTFAALLRTGSGHTLCVFGMALSIVAGASDIAENLTMLRMFSDQTTLPGLTYLWIPVRLKFFALGATAFLSGWLFLAKATLSGRIAGAACLVGGAICLVALAMPSTLGWTLGNAIGLAWVAITVFASWQTWSAWRARTAA